MSDQIVHGRGTHLSGLLGQSALEGSRPEAIVSGMSPSDEGAIIAAARNTGFVEGLTHAHYRYPARFSPVLARTAIELFSKPGDLVVDPFVGGGTTCVEALAAGRKSFGADISSLATFISKAKTAIVSDLSLRQLADWADEVSRMVSVHGPEPQFDDWASSGYLKHLGGSRWRLRRVIAQSVNHVGYLEPELQDLARLIVLRTAQWALDGRRVHSGIDGFRKMLRESGQSVAEGSSALANRAGLGAQAPLILNRSCIGIEEVPSVQDLGKARLILTSPPYPGVHVLYHRWQVGGGKETAAPFFIANQLDGSGASYYTMGGRTSGGVRSYFSQLHGALSSACALADADTTFVQVVAFSQPEWQLENYLSVARELGLQEFGLKTLAAESDGRLWRNVPNRKWYNSQRAGIPAAREVVLFHRFQA